jgi:hypothetical protein
MNPDELPVLTGKALTDARRLAALPDHRFDEEVGNFLRRPVPGKRDIFRSSLLVTKTAEALDRVRSRAEARRQDTTDKDLRKRLGGFVAAADAELRALRPYLQAARTRRGRRWRAMLRLVERNPKQFAALLADEAARDEAGHDQDWVEQAEQEMRRINANQAGAPEVDLLDPFASGGK